MKFNIAYPINGTQKVINVDDDKKCQPFFDRRMGQEVEADTLGDEWKGYVFKITGGNDKQGFPMKQGILVKGRTRILMCDGHSTFRIRRQGERKRKTVRGCIVGPDILILSVIIAKKGDQEIEGLTDKSTPRRLGPKRANKVKGLFGINLENGTGLEEAALIRKNVVRRTWTAASGKQRQKAPKVQRLVTVERIRRKELYKNGKKQRYEQSKQALADYNQLLVQFKKEQARKHSVEVARRKSSQASKQ